LLRARLQYDPGEMGQNGRLGLILVRGSSSLTQSTFLQYEPNPTDQGVIELNLNAPTVAPDFAREYAVVVRPEGDAEVTVLPYSLSIEVGPPCLADCFEPNNVPLDIPFDRRLRPNATFGTPFNGILEATLCGLDTDIYEMFAFGGESITATLEGPPGLEVEIGSRPTSLADLPPVLATGSAAMACNLGEPSIVAPSDNSGVLESPYNPESCRRAEHTVPQLQQVYFSVKRTNPSAVGRYRLRVEAAQ